MKRSASFFGYTVVAVSLAFGAQEEAQLTAERQKEFLLNANVVKSDESDKGITVPERITLSDGRMTHDAHFQVGSYSYNLAANEIAQLVGLEDMMPVTVERKLFGQTGSLEWWLPIEMAEAERMRKGIEPPDRIGWGAQIFNMRVFAYLICDIDRNPDNVLIGKDWKLFIVDFTRAFRLCHEPEVAKGLVRCSRELLDKLRKLDASEVTIRTKRYLSQAEIEGVMGRRDKMVSHFEKLIAEKGAAHVLY